MSSVARYTDRIRGWFRDWLDETGRVVLDPAAFFTDHRTDYDHSIRFAVTASILGAVLQTCALLLLTALHILPPPPHIAALPSALLPRIFFGVGGAVGGGIVAGTIGLTLLAGVLHAAVKLLGGTGLQDTVSVVAHATAVSAVFGWLLSVTGVGAAITAGYWLWVVVQGLAAVHGFSRLRALFTVLLPFLVGGLLVLAAVGVATLQFLTAF